MADPVSIMFIATAVIGMMMNPQDESAAVAATQRYLKEGIPKQALMKIKKDSPHLIEAYDKARKAVDDDY